MERSTPAVLAAATVAGTATIAGAWVLASAPAISWSGLFAVVLGPAALLGEAAGRLRRVRRSGRARTVENLQRGLAAASAVAGLLALAARDDRPTVAWILAVVLVGAAFCTALFEPARYGLARRAFAMAGTAAAAAALGVGAYLLSGSPGIAAASVASALVLAVASLPSDSAAPLPLGIGWMGPAVAVGTSVVVAQPLTDQVMAPTPGFAATVAIVSIAAGVQCVVQLAVLRILRPTVAPDLEVEGEAAAARSTAASAGRGRSSARYLDPDQLDAAERIRTYGSTTQRRVFETVLARAREFGDTSELHHLLQQYERYAPDTPFDPPPRSVFRPPEGILVSSAAVAITVATARTEGIVIDRVWPRLELVLPSPVRRRHARTDQAVALSRMVAASATAAAFALVAASLYAYAAVPLVAGLLAVVTGRGRVTEGYRQRARSITVFRMHLIRALHLPEPTTHAELIAMGGVLAGDAEFGELASPPETVVEAPNSAQLAAEVSSAVVAGLRIEMRTLEQQQEAILRDVASSVTGRSAVDRMAAQLADTTADLLDERLSATVTALRSQTDESITKAVGAVLAGPPLIAFTGYFAVELDDPRPTVHRGADGVIHASPGISIGLVVTVLADAAARDVAPDRGTTGEHDFVALETVSVDGLKSDALVQFDVLLDSAAMTPIPRRHTLQLHRVEGERSGTIQLELPDREGVHEAWLQLYQGGRLIQAVAIAVDTRLPDHAQREER
ncbi:hypothetical protein [Nocardia sp. NPDC057353]|uniref:hypothetical protein n=1 Tax=Nocardia sp. NPDC057353 TaxID=3346104 RepID=UPI003632620D